MTKIFRRLMLCGFASFVSGPAWAAPVTLQFWTIDKPDQAQQSYVLAHDFEAKNPDIRIEIKHVDFADVSNDTMRAIATGGGPDLVTIDNPEVALFAAHNALVDLSPMIAQSKVIDPKQFYPGPLASVTWKGHIFALPRGSNTLALYLNDDAFKAAGLDPAHPPATWDALRDDAGKLTVPAKNVYGIAFSAIGNEEGVFQFLPWVQSAGGDYDKIDGPAGVAALTFWQSLIDEKLASRDTLVRTQSDSFQTFVNGNAAMAISGPWELSGPIAAAKFNWSTALLPVEKPGGAHASALGEHTFAILHDSAHPAEAFRFLEYVYSQEGRDWNEFGMLPSIRLDHLAAPQHPQAYATFIEEMKYARVRGPSPHWSVVSKAIQAAYQSVLTHQASPDAALKDAQSTIDSALQSGTP